MLFSQCIVISGESGAGKTISANFLVQQLTQLGKVGQALSLTTNYSVLVRSSIVFCSLSVHLSGCPIHPSIHFLMHNNFLHSRRISFKFHACLTPIDISDKFADVHPVTLTLSQTSPGFYLSYSTSVLETLQEKEKLLITSNFYIFHIVFYPFGELSAIFIKFEIVVCKLLQFGRI